MSASESVQMSLQASGSAETRPRVAPRHPAFVRITHWITFVCFLALLVTGIEIILSHPRFYWGETGNVLTTPLFQIPVPSSRNLVQTGYGYVLPDQNGWSRALHFQTAWILVFTAIFYLLFGFTTGHFRRDLLPRTSDLSVRSMIAVVRHHLRFERPTGAEGHSYNVLQRLTYVLVIFVFFPLLIWTGLAMSPAFVSAFPSTVIALGGRQSARTLHFFVSIALVLFLLAHIALVWLSGFWNRVRAMITGHIDKPSELA